MTSVAALFGLYCRLWNWWVSPRAARVCSCPLKPFAYGSLSKQLTPGPRKGLKGVWMCRTCLKPARREQIDAIAVFVDAGDVA